VQTDLVCRNEADVVAIQGSANNQVGQFEPVPLFRHRLAMDCHKMPSLRGP